MTEIFFTILSGILVGFLFSFFGSGGSIFTVPVLVYLLGLEPKSAIASSLVIVCITALLSFFQHHKHGTVATRTGLVFAALSLFTSYLGARTSVFLTGQEQLLLFGLALMFSASLMIQKFFKHRHQPEVNKTPRWQLSILMGAGIGFLTGLIGIGGGLFIVPALHLAGLGIHAAMGTSLLVITVNALGGAMGYVGLASFSWTNIFFFLVGSLSASPIGAKAMQKLSPQKMRLGFAIFIFLTGIFIFAKNWKGL